MDAKGIIFDLDGTLIDSMPMWENVGSNFLKYIGKIPREGLRETLKPLSFNQSAQYFIDEYEVRMSVSEIIDFIHKIVASGYKNTIELKPYVYETIKRFKEENIKMCIATATDCNLATCALKRLGILDCFEFIITCDMVGFSKDKPIIYEEAASQLEAPKQDIYIFEDMLFCAKVAKKAGFKVVGVYDEASHQDSDEMIKICDKYIMSFKELA